MAENHDDDGVIHFTQLSIGFQIFLICILIGSCSGGSDSVRGDDSAELRTIQEEVRGLPVSPRGERSRSAEPTPNRNSSDSRRVHPRGRRPAGRGAETEKS
jgi:hypothetical protein